MAQSSEVVQGIRDDWLRLKWKRDYVVLTLGHPSWPLHDHRTILLGRLGQPLVKSPNEITFPISDLAEKFEARIQTQTYSSGPFQNRYKPLAFGWPLYVEMPQYDPANLKYQITTSPLAQGSKVVMRLHDNGPSPLYKAFDASFTISAVNTTTDTITTSQNHGAQVGWRFMPVGAPPAPLVSGTEYWVQAVPAANQLRLSETKGGPLLNLTGSTTGCMVYLFGWDIDLATGIVTLNNPPAGRVFVYSGIRGADRLINGAYVPGLSEPFRLANMYEAVVLNEFGMSEDLIDSESFTRLRLATQSTYAGIWLNTNRHTVREALDLIAKGSNTWYGFTFDGLFQVGRFDLPADTAVLTLTQSQIAAGSLRLTRRILPVDFTKTDVTCRPRNFVAGFMPTADGEYLVDRDYLPEGNYGAPSVPIDTAPQGETQPRQRFDLIAGYDEAVEEQTRLMEFYNKQLGVFAFETTLRALFSDDGQPINLGDTIELTFPEKDWKTWSAADPSSPDNTTDIDSTKAVIIGVAVDFYKRSPFKVTMSVYRQIPGYYPEGNLN